MGAGLLSIVLAAAPAPGVVDKEAEEIVVTGERLNRSVKDTASSVEIFTARDIEREAGADRLDQLLESIPNVTLGTSGLGPTIRGQNTTGVLQDLPAFLGGTRQRVTLQVDGRAAGFNEFVFGAAPLWDVAQVEVFRSPQSTTQGRNSIAGAIFVETADPSYRPEGRVRAIYGDISMHQLSAAISAPIVKDQLAFRLSGDLRHGSPASRLTDIQVGADPNNDDYGLLRLKFLAEPEAIQGLRVEASLAHSESKIPQVEGVKAPFRERRDPNPLYGVFGTRVDSLSLRIAQEWSPSVRSTTTLTYGDSSFRRFAPAGLGEARNLIDDWSIENVVNWRPSARFQLIAGVHHLRTYLDQSINLTAVIGNGSFRDAQQSTGLFGEAMIRPTRGLRINAGLRYQRDSQRRTGGIGSALFHLPLVYDETFEALLPKVSVAIDFTPEISGGLLVQRAYNPGGATLNFDSGDPEIFGAEHAWSYEFFARATLSRMRLNANLFHTDFRDAQRAQSRAFTVPGGGTAFWAEIENVPRSRSSGGEVSVDWDPTDRLSVAGGIGLLRTRITRTANPANPINGKEFQRSPHFTASGSIDWRPVDALRLTGSLRYHSDYFSTDTNNRALLVDAHAIANARVAWTRGRITLSGYARNLFDTFYMTYLGSATSGVAVDPREIGIGAEIAF